MVNLKDFIRNVPDFPKPGIVFRDITPLLASPEAMAAVEDGFVEAFADAPIDAVAGTESRGFIFATALARLLGVAFIPVRKAGKLPAATVSVSYTLEYGEDSLEIHADALGAGDRVLVVDDLLATGGTAAASAELVERIGGTVVGLAFVIELSFLGGRRRLEGRRVVSLVDYESE